MGDTPLRVGVAGAGPWARMFHAPAFAAHPRTELTAVWARRMSAAEELAGPCGATAHDTFDRFLEDVDAVAFAVPPDVQAALAARAARAGRALLLEKPRGPRPGAVPRRWSGWSTGAAYATQWS